jgi:thioredoxin 1
MNEKTRKILTVLLVMGALVAVVIARHHNNQKVNGDLDFDKAVATGLPVLLEIGSHTCVPCKQMMPILMELKAEYPQNFAVAFIDTAIDATAIEQYGIKLIPTQVFLDKDSKELFRHTGFYPKNDIIAKWKELDLEFENK